MHEHVAFVEALDVEVDFAQCHGDRVLWKPLVDFLIAADPHETLKLSEEATTFDTSMIACRRLQTDKVK